MATVTSYTAARMQQIEDEAITGAYLDGYNLYLVPNNGAPINLGNVRGAQGPPGIQGDVSLAQLNAAIAPLPKGLVSSDKRESDVIRTNTGLVDSMTAPVEVGRTYKVTWSGSFYVSNTIVMELWCRVNSTVHNKAFISTVSGTGNPNSVTLSESFLYDSDATEVATFEFEHRDVSNEGTSVTFTASTSNVRYFFVEDVGQTI